VKWSLTPIKISELAKPLASFWNERAHSREVRTMRTLKSLPHRYLLLVVVAAILLISGISLAASRHTNRVTAVDCAGDCRERRDKNLEQCNSLPTDQARSNCVERTNKQYDKCIERCNSDLSGNPGGN
jgi:hypothetical protein